MIFVITQKYLPSYTYQGIAVLKQAACLAIAWNGNDGSIRYLIIKTNWWIYGKNVHDRIA